MSALPSETITFRYERWRAVASGVLESASLTFLLLIAVRWYHLGPTGKALVAAAASIGMLASPFVVTIVERGGWRTARAASAIYAIGALALLTTVLLPFEPVFIGCTMVALTCCNSIIPLQTQIYQDNYPEARRGRLFSRTIMLKIATVVLFSEGAGRVLGHDISNYRWILFCFFLAAALGSYCLLRCPSRPLVKTGPHQTFRAMRYVVEDAVFRRTLICWMLMGFGNLMMLPLRVEYLANPLHGLGLSVPEVALLTGVLPNSARLIMSPIWGILFDRMNFFLLRAGLNLGFAIGILSFFGSENAAGLLFGSVVFGISNAGGDVAWALWVTKISPPDRVADYMSIHTFFTGLRGVVAPFVAFHAAAVLSISTLGWISASMIFISSLLLLPEMKAWKNGRIRSSSSA